MNQKGNTSVIVSFIALVAIVGFVVYYLMQKTQQTQVNPLEGIGTENKVQSEPQSNSQQPTQPTQQEQQSTEVKSMEVAKNGDTLSMNYTGRLENGTVFDSNVDPKFGHVKPFEFKLGAGMVIRGWDEGLVGMKVGEKKTLTIPADKGYGARAVGSIPANSTLIFEVELLGIK